MWKRASWLSATQRGSRDSVAMFTWGCVLWIYWLESAHSWESLRYIPAVILCCPVCICTKMLSDLDKARTSPAKLTGSLQALNLGIAVPKSLLGLELCPSSR